MYVSLLKDQTIILPNSMPQKSIKLDVGAIQDIDLGTRQGVILLDGNFLGVSQERGETAWILECESNSFTFRYSSVKSETDGFTLSSTESEQYSDA